MKLTWNEQWNNTFLGNSFYFQSWLPRFRSLVAYLFLFSKLVRYVTIEKFRSWFLFFLNEGAAFGRICGEGMHLWFPNGVRYGGKINPIIPGGYSGTCEQHFLFWFRIMFGFCCSHFSCGSRCLCRICHSHGLGRRDCVRNDRSNLSPGTSNDSRFNLERLRK